MTTDNLIKALRNMELVICFNSITNLLDIFDSTGSGRIAGVDTTDEYVFDMCGMAIKNLGKDKRAKLAELLYEYTSTPVEQRENNRMEKRS